MARLPVPTAPPQPPERPQRPQLRKLRFAFVLLGLCTLAFVSWIFGIMMAVAQDLPELENREQYKRAENSVVYDAHGERLATLTNNEGRILVDSDEISAAMKEAVVAIEDHRFYEHRGVDFQGIGRAVYQDVLSGSAEQGASTITQQFVKNALAAQQNRTIFQKLREAALAYHLERQWSKDKILTEYLNSIYFGEGAYGIESAARTFFGYRPEYEGCGEGDDAPTCASQLLPYDAALLAGMISSPSAYSPRANPESAVERRNLVLQRMTESGFITEEEYADYSQRDLPSADEIQAPEENSEAPYFTSWLRQQLVDRYGAGEAFGGDLEVHSTLDLELQREIEGIIDSRLAGIEPTASTVVLDNETGAVLAMVGGADFEETPFNLATQGRRQPGSAFKPFTLIAALSQGRSSSEVLTSAPKKIPFEHKVTNENGQTKIVNEVFEVANYEDKYLGSASIATATTYSDNSVYAELGHQIGEKNVAETAQQMGIESKIPTNPAMILGGLKRGVSPLEMAHAYETIAQDGQRISGSLAASDGGPVAIWKVVESNENPDAAGEPVDTNDGTAGENRVETEQVIDQTVAQEARSILTTVVESGTGTNAASEEPTWGKTGTTDDNGDAWFCGATDEITSCVWVGHATSNTPMETEFGGNPVDGGTYPALIFHDIVVAWERLQASRGIDEEDEDELEAPGDVPAPAESVPETGIEAAAPQDDADAAGGSGGGDGAGEGAGEAPAGGVAAG